MQHSRTLEELRQHLREAEHDLRSIQEEDVNVQSKKKLISNEIRQLKTAIEGAGVDHSIAKYTNEHARRLQTALGLESQVSEDRPQTQPAPRSKQRAGQQDKGFFRHQWAF